MPYKGEEHIRFADGWGDITSKGYFSYVFLWILDEDPKLTEEKVTANMNVYFTGLMKMGLLTKLRIFKKLNPTQSNFQEKETINTSFIGTIKVYDAFFKKETIILNTKIHFWYCTGIKKYLVIFRMSPKSFDDPVWIDLDNVNTVKNYCIVSDN